MKKTKEAVVTIKSYYDNDGSDIIEILKHSILLYIEREVKKLCTQNS